MPLVRSSPRLARWSYSFIPPASDNYQATTAACFDLAITKDGYRYQMPDEIAARLVPYGTTYTIIQFYRFVRGQNLTGAGTRFDCSSTNPARHWTQLTEVYCYNDFLTAVRSIRPGVTVTSPAAVANAWGRGNPNS